MNLEKLGLKTFLRIDQDMIDNILPHVSFAQLVNDENNPHWGLWFISRGAYSNVVDAWVKGQASESYAFTKFFTHVEIDDVLRLSEKDVLGTYLTIAVSYSQLSEEQVLHIGSDERALGIVHSYAIERNNMVKFKSTKNPNLWTKVKKEDNSFLYTDLGQYKRFNSRIDRSIKVAKEDLAIW